MSGDVSPEVLRVANSIGFALTERGIHVSAEDAVSAAPRRVLDQRAEFLAAEPARGRETSRALTEVRTVLSRAATARSLFELGTTEYAYRPYREYRDPDHDAMRDALDEVVRLLDRWRRTGRPRRSS